ncbi:MAG: hypothetical protein IJF39_04335 [Clostridia bacterium]|nr:hypothetical protein [Clostridia bacterium]
MKQQKTKILTLTLASLLGAAALSGGVISAAADQTETTRTPYTYTASQVFGTTNASLVVENTDTVGVSMANGGSFTLSQRDLAWKWFERKPDANYNGSYLHFTLAFADVNFSEVVITLETEMAMANEDKKAINTITFTQEGGLVYAAINKKAGDAIGTAVAVEPVANSQGTGMVERPFTIRLNQEGALDSEYNVVLVDSIGKETALGKFTNVGASYGEFASSSATTPLTPFKVSAKVPNADNDTATTEKSVVKVVDINGQSFALNADKKIEDTARPVLVVNDEITSLTFGSVFSVDYDYVDVLDKDVSKTVEYAQYNPTVADADMVYHNLTTTTYFTPTPYEVNGEKKTVYSNIEEFGVDTDGDHVNDLAREFVSIVVKLSDEYFKGDDNTTYDLSWYAANTVKVGVSEKDYIVLDENKQGATYTFLKKENGKNVVLDNANDNTDVQNSAAVLTYQGFVAKAAEGLKAGSNTNFYLPTLSDLITDDGGYQNLQFTISYKSTNSSSASNPTSSASNLKIPVAKSGTYRFKVFAVDKAGNSMKYYDKDGKLVDVSASNVWEIEEIPYFYFTIAQPAFSVEEQSGKLANRKGSVAIGKTFSGFSPTILCDDPSEVRTETKLYRIDFDRFNALFPDKNLSQSDLSAITYKEIADEATANDVDGYLRVYAGLLADLIDVNVEDLLAEDAKVFVEILPYNDKIDQELHPEEYNKNNVYEWDAEKQTFKPLNETDVYFMIAVYTDSMIPSAKACGYMVISIEQKNDVLPGESDWLKNNIASVILFSIAGVMLILIVVLLFIKPSDETLEDVDDKAKEKEKKAKPTKK